MSRVSACVTDPLQATSVTRMPSMIFLSLTSSSQEPERALNCAMNWATTSSDHQEFTESHLASHQRRELRATTLRQRLLRVWRLVEPTTHGRTSGIFFVSCALVSLSLSVTGKKRRKTKRGQRRCCTANWCKVKREAKALSCGTAGRRPEVIHGGHSQWRAEAAQKMVLAVVQHHKEGQRSLVWKGFL